MLDVGAYQRALQKRQMPWENFQQQPEGMFNPEAQLDTSRMRDIPPPPPQQVVPGQQMQQQQPDLLQLLAMILGQ